MANRLQHLRGSEAEHSTFTGAKGEISLVTDTSANRIPTGEVRVHDGTTAGGLPLTLGTTSKPLTNNIVLGSGVGINFNNYGSEDSNSATTVGNNLLDDYEEGTFTPYWSSDTGGEWAGKTTGSGFYTKVGRLIHIYGTATYSSKKEGAASTLRIRGFPFTANPNNPGVPEVGWENVIPDSGDYKVRFANTDLIFYAAFSLQGSTLIGAMPASGTYQFNFCIIV